MNDITKTDAANVVINTAVSLGKNSIELLRQQVEQLEVSRQLANHYCNTDMVPKQYQGKMESGAVAIQWGAEIGLSPLQALQNIAVINGNPSLWGDALIAIAKGSGQCEFITTHYDEEARRATVTTKRVGEPEESRSYSAQDAENAGLMGRDTYKKHLPRMLAARARSHVLRDVYADLLKGFQVREIMEEDRQQIEKDITPTAKPASALRRPAKAEEATQVEPEADDAVIVDDGLVPFDALMKYMDESTNMDELNYCRSNAEKYENGTQERDDLVAKYKARRAKILLQEDADKLAGKE